MNEKAEIISRILTTLLESDDIDTAILTLSSIVERVSKERPYDFINAVKPCLAQGNATELTAIVDTYTALLPKGDRI